MNTFYLEIEKLGKGFAVHKTVSTLEDSVAANNPSEVKTIVETWLGWWLDGPNQTPPETESA